MSEYAKEVGKWCDWVYRSVPGLPRATQEIQTVVVKEVQEMLPGHGRIFVRIAGLSGAVAVILGAYGAHVFRTSEAPEQLKVVFESGNRYHFLHTLALLAVPMMRRPYLVGTLLSTGIVLFSGSCYYHALTGNTAIRRVTPYGGITLIAAWLAMMF